MANLRLLVRNLRQWVYCPTCGCRTDAPGVHNCENHRTVTYHNNLPTLHSVATFLREWIVQCNNEPCKDESDRAYNQCLEDVLDEIEKRMGKQKP